MLNRIRGLLTEKETPVWATILFGIFTFFGTNAYQDYKSDQEKHQNELALNVRSLQLEMANFAVLVDGFTYSLIKEGKLLDDKRQLIVQNINLQHSKVDVIAKLLPAERAPVAYSYQQKLLALRSSLREVHGTEGLGAVYSEYYDLVRLQSQMVTELQRQAGVIS